MSEKDRKAPRRHPTSTPVWAVLEDSFDCLLVKWIAKLLAHGLLRGSFVPPKPIRRLRDLTRFRKALIEERTRAVNRLHKLLEDAGVKLSCVATDVMGVSGRAMMRALIDGQAEPEALAELAKGKLRKKLPELRKALTHRWLTLRDRQAYPARPVV